MASPAGGAVWRVPMESPYGESLWRVPLEDILWARLQAALERRVLLDVLLVLVQRGGPNQPELPARQLRLEQVAWI